MRSDGSTTALPSTIRYPSNWLSMILTLLQSVNRLPDPKDYNFWC